MQDNAYCSPSTNSMYFASVYSVFEQEKSSLYLLYLWVEK